MWQRLQPKMWPRSRGFRGRSNVNRCNGKNGVTEYGRRGWIGSGGPGVPWQRDVQVEKPGMCSTSSTIHVSYHRNFFLWVLQSSDLDLQLEQLTLQNVFSLFNCPPFRQWCHCMCPSSQLCDSIIELWWGWDWVLMQLMISSSYKYYLCTTS